MNLFIRLFLVVLRAFRYRPGAFPPFGLLRLAFRAHWLPVLGGVTIRFVRPLRPWQRYDLVTRVVGWDEKWFYLEQRFESGEKLIARAMVKALMRGPDGSIPSGILLAQLGIAESSPPLPPEITHLPA